ncbi:MAG: hypothetical protein HC767_09105 [Akkermansiaceae bacterium]|nr:hypothetical protein [Akkermansiaceae bacterium]
MININSKGLAFLVDAYCTHVELEESESLEAHMPDIGELLEAARKPKRDNLGGVDSYLARILCLKQPEDMTTAIGRLSLGHIHGMPVRFSALPLLHVHACNACLCLVTHHKAK